jgi:hypothetical protein
VLVREIVPDEPFSITMGVPLVPTLPEMELRDMVGLEMENAEPDCEMLPEPPAESVAEVVPVTVLEPREILPLLFVLVEATVLRETIGAERLPARVMPAELLAVLLALTSRLKVAPEPERVAALRVTVPVEMEVIYEPTVSLAELVRVIAPLVPFSITIGVPLLPTLPEVEVNVIVGADITSELPD